MRSVSSIRILPQKYIVLNSRGRDVAAELDAFSPCSRRGTKTLFILLILPNCCSHINPSAAVFAQPRSIRYSDNIFQDTFVMSPASYGVFHLALIGRASLTTSEDTRVLTHITPGPGPVLQNNTAPSPKSTCQPKKEKVRQKIIRVQSVTLRISTKRRQSCSFSSLSAPIAGLCPNKEYEPRRAR